MYRTVGHHSPHETAKAENRFFSIVLCDPDTTCTNIDRWTWAECKRNCGPSAQSIQWPTKRFPNPSTATHSLLWMWIDILSCPASLAHYNGISVTL